MDRVNAQQARRILGPDRRVRDLAALWRKVAKGLSAGRVQSVAVRLVVDREREIGRSCRRSSGRSAASSPPTPASTTCTQLAAKWHDFLTNTGNGERTKIERERWLTDHDAFAPSWSSWRQEVRGRQQGRRPPAAELLGFVLDRDETTEDADAKGPGAARHPLCAAHAARARGSRPRHRAEAHDQPPAGPVHHQHAPAGRRQPTAHGRQAHDAGRPGFVRAGHITYMRTDSTHLSGDALTMARGFIDSSSVPGTCPEKPELLRQLQQERTGGPRGDPPDGRDFTPEMARAKLGSDDARLYDLIWRRFVACQMSPAEFDQTAVTIVGSTKEGDAVFRATGRKLVFDGFMRVAGVSSEDQLLPDLKEQQPVFPIEVDPTQHFTQPPPRYTEASLVKMLEQLGIGRPSTYASIIQTIQDRQYVAAAGPAVLRHAARHRGDGQADPGVPRHPGREVHGRMELQARRGRGEPRRLGQAAPRLLRPVPRGVDGALEKIEHAGGAPSPYKCPKCGKPMLYRISKNGFFLACSDRECTRPSRSTRRASRPSARSASSSAPSAAGR
jgi:DNA topoisomerase-1